MNNYDAIKLLVLSCLVQASRAGFCYTEAGCESGLITIEGYEITKNDCPDEYGMSYKSCPDTPCLEVGRRRERGLVSIEEEPEPPCESMMVGDPHIKTWNGTWYDFHGECDLVFVHAPQLDLDLHVRTKIRYDYSYITHAAVRLGDDILEVAGWGDYLLNSVGHADLPATMNNGLYTVTYSKISDKEHVFEIAITDTVSLTLHTFKDWVGVKMSGRSVELFGESVGLMGAFDSGAWLDRDGKTVLEDPNTFGQAWQVQQEEPKLFVATRAPQHPTEACILPSEKTASASAGRRRLGMTIARETAEAACDKWGAQQRSLCVQDVMQSGDLEIAASGMF